MFNLNFQEKPRRNRIESDSEYDSEMDDFIDDTEDKIDISKEIRSIFGYVLTKKPDLTSLLEFVILTLVIIEINGPYGTEFFFFS